MASKRLEAQARTRRRARIVGVVGVLAAALTPPLLWHEVLAMAVGEFRPTPRYVMTGLLPWLLMGTGVACAGPVIWHDLRDRHRRFHGGSTAAWAGWGITLYILGFALATQVSALVDISRYGGN
jgi:hypothetical protein